METGKRFWLLIGFVAFILVAYALLELSDAVAARQTQLKGAQTLLARQETLLNDNHWNINLRTAEQARKDWLNYLPVEKTPTFAKAHLLSDLNQYAKEAGMFNIIVTATDAEGGDTANDKMNDKSATSYVSRPPPRFGVEKKKEASLPTGVQMIKLTISGRFDPATFYKFMQKLEDSQRFSVIDRVTVRGVQLELGVRCYWRVGTIAQAESKPVTGNPSLATEKKTF
jgi:hypothetical protein